MRRGVLALSSHVSWGYHEIMGMPTSMLIWWLQGLPKQKNPRK